SFAAPASGATANLSSSTAITDAAGHASVTATASTVAGAFTVNASAAGTGSPVAFQPTNTAGAATSLGKVSGDGQNATVNQAFAVPLVLGVFDTYGNPVSGVAVAYSSPSSGASAVPTAAVIPTDASGQASFSVSANTVAGSYSVAAL